MTDTPDLPTVDLPDYDTWVAESERGASDAHTDAARPLEDRMTPDEVTDQGTAYWSGYNTHWATLQTAGVVR